MADKAISVSFHGDNLYLVNHNGEPYTPMKPIVENMGMDWMGQYTKLKQRFSKGIEEISIPTPGGNQKMLCLALRKLNGWLQTISPNKVNPEIRDKVIQYQNECDDVLYEYWTTGEVKRKAKTTVDERTPLRDAVNMLVSKKHLMYDEAYMLVHQRFNVDSITELAAEQIPQAIEYIHRIVIDGEYIGAEQPKPELTINYPLSWFADNCSYVRVNYWNRTQLQLDPSVLMEAPSPSMRLLHELQRHGYEVSAPAAEIQALRHIMTEMRWALKEISRMAEKKTMPMLSIRL
ncbi:phage antirepressor N-terminal domain-containing protein [Serratia ureilytica]|uniref:phage antirepressor N-terminal domain-containing protein n=1 Tax=Serratia ureilytica TaxID=300181 RepID=UPI0037226766